MVIQDYDLLFAGNGNEIKKWMYSYRLRAVKNYKEAFQFIRVTKMERFNSRSYFHCVNNKINFSTVAVDLNRVPPVITKG